MAEPPTTLWAVTKGAYDDYRVEVLFTTEALADAHAATIDGEVTAFALYDQLPPQATVYYREGWVNAHGRLIEDRVYEQAEWEYTLSGPFAPLMGARITNWRIHVWGTDLDAVTQAYAAQVAKAQARRLRVAAPRKDHIP